MSEKYSKLWTKPFYYVLGPLPPHEVALKDAGLCYYPYRWVGTYYAIVSILEQHIVDVVQKMLEAGVPIIDPLPQETIEQALAHFWTDRLHEFALIGSGVGDEMSHYIYRLDPPEYLIIPIDYAIYQNVVNHMLLAGATVLSERPDSPKA